jgi:hypothetical protein
MFIRFFNLDLHVSVIEDIKTIWKDILPNVIIDDWSISGHSKLFPHFREHCNTAINETNWKRFDETMVKHFQFLYDSMLSTYDGFIVTHTPIFIMLFEKYNKPIFVINSCRYNQPMCWNKNRFMIDKFHQCLKRLDAKNLLTFIHNNAADEIFFKKNVTLIHQQYYIPSLCSYTNWTYPHTTIPIYDNILVDDPFNIVNIHSPLIRKPHSYKYSEIYKYKAVIIIPRELSYMTFFEYIQTGIPIIIPSKEYLTQLLQDNKIRLGTLLDYNLMSENIMEWLEYADYYQEDIKHILHYFDNLKHLEQILSDSKTYDNTLNIKYITLRKDIIYRRWKYIWHYRYQPFISTHFWENHFGVVKTIPNHNNNYTIVFTTPQSSQIINQCIDDKRCNIILMVGELMDHVPTHEKIKIVPIGFESNYTNIIFKQFWSSKSFIKTIDLCDRYNFKMPRKHSFKNTIHFSYVTDKIQLYKSLEKCRFAIVLPKEDPHYFYECILHRCIPIITTNLKYSGFPCIPIIDDKDWCSPLFNKYYDSINWDDIHKLLICDSYVF